MTYEELTAGINDRVKQEVDFTHPWVERYRVPVVSSLLGSTYLIAGLIVPREGEENFYGFLTPDEEDAKLVGLYIQFRRRWYNNMFLRQLDERSIDIDPGVNTVTFALRDHGWVYRRSTWETSFSPNPWAEVQYPTLLGLLNHERAFCGETDPKWTAFLAENNYS